MEEEKALQYGSHCIRYTLLFSERKTMGLRVHPSGLVRVLAPLGTSAERLEQKLREKAPWLLRQLAEFASYKPLQPARQFCSGETHLYLGKQYRLKVVQAPAQAVKLERGYLWVYTPDKAATPTLVAEWYLQKARQWTAQLLPHCQKMFPGKYQSKLCPTGVVWQSMPTRWGSCTPKGRILLNPELMKAPKGCLIYVLVHELCHLIHYNHTKAFYALQAEVLPDWQVWKHKLEGYASAAQLPNWEL